MFERTSTTDVPNKTCNDTLMAFDSDFCTLLEEEHDDYITGRLKRCFQELSKIEAIDYDERIRTAYESYNEALVYYQLKYKYKCFIKDIPENRNKTPDYELTYSEDNDNIEKKVFLELKAIAFAGGIGAYKKGQKDALAANISIEKQISIQQSYGRKVVFACAEREVCPLGHGTLQEQLNEIIKKVDNNYKKEQFAFGDTILAVDLNQIGMTYDELDCRAITRSSNKIGYATGRLWVLACGTKGDAFYSTPEFEGKPNIDRSPLMFNGVLKTYSDMKGVIFFLGRTPENRCAVGFYRYNESDGSVAAIIQSVCKDFNGDLNSIYDYSLVNKRR